ncbi:MAG TPA: threonine synthase [Kiritimatiellia bacterium]|nr:threonine synthase [Kiritimatiellia bacterium]
MSYISTRGGGAPMGFTQAAMTGLAEDGGLLVPVSLPDVSGRLGEWGELSYPDLALEVMGLFSDLERSDLEGLVRRSYGTFRHPEVTPVVEVGRVRILELFHGPTLAFKDVALQFLCNLFELVLGREGGHLNILGATSGDTGSAAIHGAKGRERIRIFIMHPHGRVSPLQERQMTTVLDENVFNLSVHGTFDDCQRIMKTLFEDVEFKSGYSLGAINSVNWARVLAQIVYYFYAGLRTLKETGAEAVQFSVPTGNFGDVLAGYYAKKMGLPVRTLMVATNENDILARFFQTGVYAKGEVVPTISPSMDIQVASNFERYLFDRVGQDSGVLRDLMARFGRTGSCSLGPEHGGDRLFYAGVGTTKDTLEVIGRYHREYGYLLDPHTAVGVHVAEQALSEDVPTICLATAHPAKFGDAIKDATGEDLARHEVLERLRDLPTRSVEMPADLDAVRDYVKAHGVE